jgi:hypothetical protein
MPVKARRPLSAAAPDLAQDAFQAQHALYRQSAHPDAALRRVTRNVADQPAAWLAARGLITERQFEAAERLRMDWERAHTAPSVTMSWSAAPPGRTARGAHEPLDPGPAQIAAQRRVLAALEDVGPGFAQVLRHVVCEGQGLEAAERLLKWPSRSAKLMLGFALDRLADHMKLKK